MPSGPRLVFLVIESKNLAAESKEFIHLQSDSNRWPPDSSTEGLTGLRGICTHPGTSCSAPEVGQQLTEERS